jgi:3-oxoacyl-[acyl-carrier-protein] synthase II
MHPLSPEETGNDTFYTLKSSLYEAGVKPSEIDMVNCHASSTVVGDISEARGVRKVLNHKKAWNDLEELNKLEPSEIKEEDLDDN